jgi:hypothetical protein
LWHNLNNETKEQILDRSPYKASCRYHFYGFPNIEKEYFAETVGIQDDAVMKLCGLIFYNF